MHLHVSSSLRPCDEAAAWDFPAVSLLRQDLLNTLYLAVVTAAFDLTVDAGANANVGLQLVIVRYS